MSIMNFAGTSASRVDGFDLGLSGSATNPDGAGEQDREPAPVAARAVRERTAATNYARRAPRLSGLDPLVIARSGVPPVRQNGSHQVVDLAGMKVPAHLEVAAERYAEIDVDLDPYSRTYWCFMRPGGRPSFTMDLLRDLSAMQHSIKRLSAERRAIEGAPIQFFVVGSRVPGVFNLGGDLNLLAEHIRRGDRASLKLYARACIDVVYNNAVSYDLPIVTIALVQGDALGGGFEAALSCDVIVAERGVKLGLPEVLFNLFPGMGAVSFLSRRLGAARAEAMILSGRLYGAEELHEMGLVQILAAPGCGEDAVQDYIERTSRRHNAHQAVYEAARRINPLTYAELEQVIDIWVDAAMNLSEADLRKMVRLVAAQNRRQSTGSPEAG